MLKFTKSAGVLLLALSILLSGCSQKAQPSPTPDSQMVITQAAQTAQALLTNAAILTPSATATLPPTQTATMAPATSTFIPTLITPLASATITIQTSPDRAIYVDQSPADGSIVTPGSEFNVVWRVKNTGTTTWTTQYRLRFYAGTQMSPVNAVALPNTVKPQEEVQITLPIRAPAAPGEYNTIWVLSNAQDSNFFNVFIRIVVAGATATATVEVTPTVEATLTPTP